MRITFILLFSFISFLSIAQMRYSTKNKGAIKLFQKAMAAPGKALNPETRMPDYQSGLDLLEKALKQESHQ